MRIRSPPPRRTTWPRPHPGPSAHTCWWATLLMAQRSCPVSGISGWVMFRVRRRSGLGTCRGGAGAGLVGGARAAPQQGGSDLACRLFGGAGVAVQVASSGWHWAAVHGLHAATTAMHRTNCVSHAATAEALRANPSRRLGTSACRPVTHTPTHPAHGGAVDPPGHALVLVAQQARVDDELRILLGSPGGHRPWLRRRRLRQRLGGATVAQHSVACSVGEGRAWGGGLGQSADVCAVIE